jgi:hypothetical protein
MTRRNYAARTQQTLRAAQILCRAANTKPEVVEDQDGNLVRQWTDAELRSYRQDDIALALRRQRIVEIAELLAEIPISAIKNAVYKGWIVKDGAAQYFWVTELAQRELDLPKKDAMGRKIRFLQTGSARGPQTIPAIDKLLAPCLPNVSFRAAA